MQPADEFCVLLQTIPSFILRTEGLRNATVNVNGMDYKRAVLSYSEQRD